VLIVQFIFAVRLRFVFKAVCVRLRFVLKAVCVRVAFVLKAVCGCLCYTIIKIVIIFHNLKSIIGHIYLIHDARNKRVF
jgi:hypothetical protein